MAASFKFNRKLPNILRQYVLETKIFPSANRKISTCGVCLGQAEQKFKEKNHELSEQSSNGDGPQKIIVPRKIERSPTAILEALMSTVKYDVNQPMYLALDDPRLLPLTDNMKKNQMAAKDNGRKAAQLMISMYPDYFTQIWHSDELSEGYSYDPYQGYQHKEANEAALIERIKAKQVRDAFDVYQTCKKKGISLSQDVQEHLLELLAVYNCKTPEKTSEIRHFIEPNFREIFRNLPENTWMRGNEAEEVFNSLPDKTVTAYNNLLRGIASNGDEDAAFKLYYEMKEQNIPVDVYTYTKLIRLAPLNKETVEDSILIVQSLLQDMHEAGVHPTLETFNASIGSLRGFSRFSKAQQFAFSLLSEMAACGIEPQLSTFEMIVNLMYYNKDRARKDPRLFESILNYMQGKEYEIKSVHDTTFFISTVRSLSAHFPDSSYALKLNDILKTGNNFKALGGRQFLFSYYVNLFSIITPLEHTDVVMDIFDSIVPHIFNPTIEIYISILENIVLHDTYHYIPQIYTAINSAGVIYKEPMMKSFIDCMATKKQEAELQEKFAEIASSLINSYQEYLEDKAGGKFNNFNGIRGSSFGNFILIFLNNEDPNQALNAYKFYKEDAHLKREDLSEKSITRLTEHCISVKDYDHVQELLEQMLEVNRGKVPELVDLLLSSESTELSEQERNYYLGLKQDAQSDTGIEKKKSSTKRITKKSSVRKNNH